ncbi:hypothetical protein NECAME_13739 [Necator americanus]|uniref:Secreted protein n=1 Tax=Necator americanus TaxID=51031 RepID=W2SSN4_NECAM|nr:hypothetical protein NECAME_13739 [Necator americanus]ETN72749.1 hypothetical protein NECAME_13739 [Necator americanus]
MTNNKGHHALSLTVVIALPVPAISAKLSTPLHRYGSVVVDRYERIRVILVRDKRSPQTQAGVTARRRGVGGRLSILCRNGKKTPPDSFYGTNSAEHRGHRNSPEIEILSGRHRGNSTTKYDLNSWNNANPLQCISDSEDFLE